MRKQRHSERDRVSILIPAYQAEAFIDRTLFFARGQTYSNLSIKVSVDAGDDDTSDVVHRHADQDPRISVFEQKERLGWAGNINYLIEQVDDPFFLVYFHDDILLPQYTATLLDYLQNDSVAAGVYCDMGHFGASSAISRGPEYGGSTVQRLLTFLLSMKRGSPLRAMLRTEVAGHLRMKDMGSGGFWANEPFLMDMLLCGPLGHLSEVLYLRWSRREASLTEGWKSWDAPQAIDGWRKNIEARIEVLERAARNDEERRVLTFALYVNAFPMLRNLRDDDGMLVFRSGNDLHPWFADPGTPDLVAKFGESLHKLAIWRYSRCNPPTGSSDVGV